MQLRQGHIHMILAHGQQQLKNQRHLMKVYYYQQEQVKILVKWEYMIWQEMYWSGHSNILLTPTVLVPIEEAVTTIQAVSIQRATVASALRPFCSTLLALG